jgi:hypothetical protein
MFLFSHVSASAGVTDLKLSTAQIFDVQWNISGGKLNASGFNYIYSSINYATQTTSAARWTAAQTTDAGSNGRYISFFNSTTHPGTYGMAVYNSDGSMYKLINNTGSFRTLADGAIFYNGNGMWGTLITTKQGFSLGQSASFTITQEYPTNQQLEAYVPDSSTPLAAGETAQPTAPPPPPPPPTPVYGAAGPTAAQQTQRTNALNQNPLGHNAIATVDGDDNIVTIQQIGSAGHYANVNIQGNINEVAVNQTGSVGPGHFLNATLVGNSNSLTATQSGNSKIQFVSVNGSNNTITTEQKDTGSHFLNLGVTGDNHTVGVLQQGAGNHSANVVLTGSQPWNLQVNQSGSANQNYSLPHGMSDGSTVSGSCAAIGGCNLIINQQ